MYTLYDTLGVSRTATRRDIRAAFFALARRHHPDKHVKPPTATTCCDGAAAHAASFREAQRAYQVLANRDARDAYDALITPTLSSSSSSWWTRADGGIGIVTDTVPLEEFDLDGRYPCRCGGHYIYAGEPLSEAASTTASGEQCAAGGVRGGYGALARGAPPHRQRDDGDDDDDDESGKGFCGRATVAQAHCDTCSLSVAVVAAANEDEEDDAENAER